MRNIKFHTGQVLVEILLAFALSSVALVGMAQIATKSLSNSTYSKNRIEANKYAVQGIEWLRGQKNITAWTTFIGVSGTRCLNWDLPVLAPSSVTALSAPSPTCPTANLQDANYSGGSVNFSRTVVFTPSPPSQQTVNVIVSWNDKFGTQSSSQTIIFNQY